MSEVWKPPFSIRKPSGIKLFFTYKAENSQYFMLASSLYYAKELCLWNYSSLQIFRINHEFTCKWKLKAFIMGEKIHKDDPKYSFYFALREDWSPLHQCKTRNSALSS
jgi:hypothetical protein